eukprot:490857_1
MICSWLLFLLISATSSNHTIVDEWIKSLPDEQTLMQALHSLTEQIAMLPFGSNHQSPNARSCHFPYNITIFSNCHNRTINALSVDLEQTKKPFLIMKSLLHLLISWYLPQTHSIEPSLPLSQLLQLIDKPLSLSQLHRIYDHMIFVFPCKMQLSSTCKIFYSLYYIQYIRFISAGKLDVVHCLGEGVEAVVFKVTDTIYNSQRNVFALKLHKSPSEVYCVKEEMIMDRIQKFSDDIVFEIAVPKRIESINGVQINCTSQHAILMEYIDGDMLRNIDLNETQALDMYVQLSQTIQRLGEIGISHNDLNECNIMVDAYGKWYLIDLGFGFDIHALNVDTMEWPIVGSWAYYSPHLFALSTLKKEYAVCFKSLSDVFEVRLCKTTWTKLMVDGNLYSLEAIILTKLVRYLDTFYQTYEGIISAIHLKIDNILKANKCRFNEEVKEELVNVWMMRYVMLTKYLKNNMHLVSMFSKLNRNYKRMDLRQLAIQRDIDDVSSIKSLLLSPDSLARCKCCV